MAKVVRAIIGVVLVVVGVFTGNPQLIISGLSMTISALTTPDAKKANAATNQRLSKTLVPEDSRKIVFGRTAAACDLRYWEVWGADYKKYDEVVAACTHKIQSYQEFYLEDAAVSFSGNAATGDYAGVLSKYTSTEGVTGTRVTSVGFGSLWTTASSMTGCAHYALKWVVDQNKLPNGVPSRYTQVVEGALVYDPRRDSTRGGSGSHRANDQTTWEYSPLDSNSKPIGRNNALQVLWYLIGWKLNGRTIAGRGVALEDIDFAGFIQAANDCETAGWYSDCVLSTGDSHSTNEGILALAASGQLLDTGGLWTYRVAVDDTATVAVTLTDDDILGGVEWQPKRPISEQYNEVAGTYVDPSPVSLYQARAYPAQTLPATQFVTNKLINSMDAVAGSWTRTLVTVTADQTLAPDGSTAMDKVAIATSAGTHSIKSGAVTITAGAQSTVSWYLKANTRKIALLRLANTGETVYAQMTVDLSTGTIFTAPNQVGGATGFNGGVETIGNGVYRVWVTGVIPTVTSVIAALYFLDDTGTSSWTGDGTTGFYVWGAQLESGAGLSYPQVFVPTIASAATIPIMGYRRRKTLNFQSVQDPLQAQKLASLALNRLQLQGVFKARFNWRSLKAQNWDCVRVTFSRYGWVNKLFRVTQQGLSGDGGVDLVMIEEDPSVYVPGATVGVTSTAGVGYNPQTQYAVSGFTATPLSVTNGSGAATDGATLTWTAAPTPNVKRVEIQYKKTSASVWTPLTPASTDVSMNVLPLLPSTGYTFQIRFISFNDVEGTWASTTMTTTATSAVPASGVTAGDASNLIGDPVFVDQTNYWLPPSTAAAAFDTSSTVTTTLAAPVGVKHTATGATGQPECHISTRADKIVVEPGSYYSASLRQVNKTGFNGQGRLVIHWLKQDGTASAGADVVGVGTDFRVTAAAVDSTEDVTVTRAQAPADAFYAQLRHDCIWPAAAASACSVYQSLPRMTKAPPVQTLAGTEIRGDANVSIGSGNSSVFMSGTDTNFLFWAGNSTANAAPFRVTKAGKAIATDFEQRLNDGTLIWSSTGGYTDAGKLSFLSNAAGTIPTTAVVQGPALHVANTTSVPSGNKVKAFLGGDSTVTVGVSFPLSGASSGGSGYSVWPSTLTLTVYERYSVDNVTFGSWGSVGTVSLTKVLSTTPTGSQYEIDTYTVDEPFYNFSIQEWDTRSTTYYQPVSPSAATIAVSAASKTAGYYEYCVVGPTTGAWSTITSTVTLTDTDGTPSYILGSSNPLASVNFPNPVGFVNGLLVTTPASSTQTVAVSARQIVMTTPSGLVRTVAGLSATLNVSTGTGANKLDTGTVAASTIYYIWAISSGTTDAVLASLSQTSPTMPSGYSYKKLVGFFKTNSGATIRPFIQNNDIGQFINTSVDNLEIMFTGAFANISTPTYNSVVAANYVSGAAVEIHMQLHSQGSGGVQVAPNTAYGALGSANNPAPFSARNNGHRTVARMTIEDGNVYANSDDGSARVRCIGYRLNI